MSHYCIISAQVHRTLFHFMIDSTRSLTLPPLLAQILFGRCLVDSDQNPNLEQRLENILVYTTEVVYENICRGLFERHKLVFSSAICFQILRHRGEIDDSEWNFFIRGGGAADKQGMPPNPDPEKITQAQWDVVWAAESLVFRAPLTDDEIAAKEKAKKEVAQYCLNTYLPAYLPGCLPTDLPSCRRTYLLIHLPYEHLWTKFH